MQHDLEVLSGVLNSVAASLPLDVLDMNDEVVLIVLGHFSETFTIINRLLLKVHHDLANIHQIHENEDYAP